MNNKEKNCINQILISGLLNKAIRSYRLTFRLGCPSTDQCRSTLQPVLFIQHDVYERETLQFYFDAAYQYRKREGTF